MRYLIPVTFAMTVVAAGSIYCPVFADDSQGKPSLAEQYCNRGIARVEEGDYDSAISDFGAAIRLKPSYAEAFNGRGNAYSDKGAYDRAISDYDEAIRIKPNYAEAYNNRGNTENSKGDQDRAIADLDEAIRLSPDYANAFSNRGLARSRKGDYDRAVSDYDQAIRLQPDFAIAFNNRGFAYDQKGDHDRAIADYDQAIRLKPDFARAFYHRGDALEEKGDHGRAIADFDEAIRLQPDFADAVRHREGAIAAQAKIAKTTAPTTIAPAQPIPEPTSATVLGKRVALVIGNAGYKNAALTNPLVDADLVAVSLRKMSFDVTEVKDADFGTFDEALTSFARKEEGADVALFYFAGHGFAVNDGLRPRNYLMSTSADLHATSDTVLRRDGLPLDDIMDRISKPAKITLAFVDACRNDPFHRGGGDRGFARIEVPLDRQIYVGMSTQLGQTALDGDDGQGSPFAQAFAETMSKPGQRIDDAFRSLRQKVLQKTDGKQQPEIVEDDLREGSIVLVGR